MDRSIALIDAETKADITSKINEYRFQNLIVSNIIPKRFTKRSVSISFRRGKSFY